MDTLLFKNTEFYELSIKSYIFNRIKAELYMSYKCKIHHNDSKPNFECYYCLTDKLLENNKFESQLDNIDNAIDLTDIINKNMDKYLKYMDKYFMNIENVLECSLYD